MNYIDPVTTTAEQLLAGTNLPEDPSPAWTTGTTYAIGDYVHLVSTHRVYRDSVGGVSTASPDADSTRWKDDRPTNLWAPFDEYTDTAATTTTQDIIYALASRYVNSMAIYGLVGRGVVVEVYKTPSAVTPAWRYPISGEARLKAAAMGYWDYAYGERRRRRDLLLTGMPIYPNAKIVITVTGSVGQEREIGMISRGKFRTLGGMGWGGVEEGAEVIPKTYTFREVGADGKQRIIPRGTSKDLRFTINMERKYADNAVASLTGMLSRPVAWALSSEPGFTGLSVFGILTQGPVRYRYNTAQINATVEGYV